MALRWIQTCSFNLIHKSSRGQFQNIISYSFSKLNYQQFDKLIPTCVEIINRDTFANHIRYFREFNVNLLDDLSGPEMAKLTYMIHLNYRKDQPSMTKFLNRLENIIAKDFTYYSTESTCTMVHNFYEAYDKGYNFRNIDFLKRILDCLNLDRRHPKFLRCLMNISLYEKEFNKFNIYCYDSFVDFARRTSQDYIENLSLLDFSYLIAAYKNIIPGYGNDKFLISNGRDIFSVAEETVLAKLDKWISLNIDTTFYILFTFINANKGTEDLKRKLEGHLIPRLNEIRINTFIAFAFAYKSRILHDYRYMIESI